jgi:hypothetical protein
MDKYVVHSYFQAIDINDVDVILGYSCMDLMDTINVNVSNFFIKLWYKKKKITLQDMSLSKKEGTMGVAKEVLSNSEVASKAKVTKALE